MKNTNKPDSYYLGYDAKVKEIKGMGFDAAKEKLNLDYPVGEEYKGSMDGFYYMHGEADALVDLMN